MFHLGSKSGIRVFGNYVSPDPLAGIPFSIRLQTHVPGSNTPLGLFQDVACTMPATQDGDPIAAWKDVLSNSGLIATQSDTQKQPILFFDNGVPSVLFDGVDDFLSGISISPSTTISLFAAVNVAARVSDRCIVGPSDASGGPYYFVSPNGNFPQDLFNDNVSGFSSGLTTIPLDTYSLTSCILSSGSLNYWLNGSTDGSFSASTTFTSPITQVGAIRGGSVWSGSMVSVMAGVTDLTSSRSLIESYESSLLP